MSGFIAVGIGIRMATKCVLVSGAYYSLIHQPGLRFGYGVALLVALAVQSYVLVVYLRDQRFLRQFMDRTASPALPPSEQVKCIVYSFRGKPIDPNDKFFLASVFRFLRPTPRQVAELGGCCSDRCRLIVVLLGLRGIRASKWAIYSPDLVPCHAVVELETESGQMVVDPSYGLWFPRPDGGYYGVEQLRNHPEILPRRIQELRAQDNPIGLANLASYPLDKYTFTHARTMNWDKIWVSRLLYRLLYRLMGPRVNKAFRPAWAEQPALIILCTVFLVELLCLAGCLI
jgi:hypothetical protein